MPANSEVFRSELNGIRSVDSLVKIEVFLFAFIFLFLKNL